MIRAYLKLITIICLVVVSTFSIHAANASKHINYHIQYLNQAPAKLIITASFSGSQGERTLIHIPAEGVTNLTATADNIPTEIVNNPADPSHNTRYVLHHRPGALINIRYNVSQVFSDPPTAASLWQAIINPTYFYFIGEKIFAWPDQFKQEITVSFRWNMPPLIKIFNSFGIQQNSQTANLQNIDELNSSLFVGGDFRIINNNQQNNGQTIYTVIRGKWPFTDAEYSERISSEFSAINNFWPVGHPKIFLNVLLPVSSLSNTKMSSNSASKFGVGGLELNNAFVLMATVPETMDTIWQRILSIATHEYNHNWVAKRLAFVKENDLGGKWFSEGLNEYMAQILRLHDRKMTLQEYVDRSNKVVAAYFTSPAFGEYIDMGEYPALSKETVYSIMQPYYRGELLAWRWTLASTKHPPIEPMLLQMIRDAEIKLPIYTDTLVAEYLTQAGVVDALNDIQRYARHGDEIPLSGKELGPCVTAMKIPMLRYNIGFDLQKSKRLGKIVGLKQNGPASKAGLKEGDEFTHLGYDYGNPDVPVQIKLKASQVSNHSIITYSPSEHIQVLQYVLIPMKQVPSSCYTFL